MLPVLQPKEAFFKALGTGYRYGMAFHEIEVLNDELGKPFIKPHGKVKEYLENNKVSHHSPDHLPCKENGQCFCST